jgi:hypothetical protein
LSSHVGQSVVQAVEGLVGRPAWLALG